MRTADFDYFLPSSLIAQVPLARREDSRLLVLRRQTGELQHRQFRDIIDLLPSPAVLVFNDSKVIRARLRAQNPRTGGAFEILLLEQNRTNDWWAMVRPGKRAPRGSTLALRSPITGATEITATVLDINVEGHRRLEFHGTPNLLDRLEDLGELPLPPYIERPTGARNPEDDARYQTVYAARPGSVAAPTAGLHFTPELLSALRERGITLARTTLHVGAGTFAPVKTDQVADHRMHSEWYCLDAENAALIERARQQQNPIIAVGTTTLRVLESIAQQNPTTLAATEGRTNIFIYPPATFRLASSLITNFHLPQSTLLMLVSAFAAPGSASGRDLIFRAYQEAIERKYRFFSYGDAMWIH